MFASRPPSSHDRNTFFEDLTMAYLSIVIVLLVMILIVVLAPFLLAAQSSNPSQPHVSPAAAQPPATSESATASATPTPQPTISPDGWFVVDGIYVRPVDPHTDSVVPADCIADYQSGDWDGTVRTSPDYSTQVWIEDGRLTYHYTRRLYAAEADPQGLAYTGYAEDPVYRDLPDDLQTIVYQNATHHHGCDQHDETVIIDFWPDLPVATRPQATIAVASRATRNRDHGTYVALADRVDFYRYGRVCDSISLSVAPDAELILDVDGSVYLYSDAQLWQLDFSHQSAQPLATDPVCGLVTNQDGLLSFFTLSQSGELRLHDPSQPSSHGRILDGSVTKVDVGSQVLLIEREQGGVYAADTLVSLLANSDTTLHWLYLGPEEHAYYRGYLAADPLNALARAKQLAETATSP